MIRPLSLLSSPGLPLARVLAVSLLALSLAACGVTRQTSAPELLDLGTAPMASTPAGPARPPLLLDQVEVAPLIESPSVVWRDGEFGQPQRYAYFRWIAAPGQLVEQRFREVLSRNGPVLSRITAAQSLQLHVSLDRFEQVFVAGRSHAQLSMRVLVTRGSQVLDQLRVDERVDATSDDAPGGADALRQATDRAVTRVAEWLGGIDLSPVARPGTGAVSTPASSASSVRAVSPASPVSPVRR
jgi:cholesterol transport system auxiliary component